MVWEYQASTLVVGILIENSLGSTSLLQDRPSMHIPSDHQPPTIDSINEDKNSALKILNNSLLLPSGPCGFCICNSRWCLS